VHPFVLASRPLSRHRRKLLPGRILFFSIFFRFPHGSLLIRFPRSGLASLASTIAHPGGFTIVIIAFAAPFDQLSS